MPAILEKYWTKRMSSKLAYPFKMKFLVLSLTFIEIACLFSKAEYADGDACPPPARLKKPMITSYRQINNGGPPAPYPRAAEALSLPLLSMIEPLADSIMLDIKAGLQYVLQTKSEWIIPLHGTGTTAASAILDNLIEPGERVLVGVNGYWSDMMANMSVRVGAHVIRYEKPPGTRYTLAEIESALRAYRPQLLVMVMGESSTTIYQPLDGVGELCEKYGTLLVVDVVGVAGVQPVLMDKLKIDAAYTSSQKGLGAATGLAPVALSARAVAKLKQRKSLSKAYQTDLIQQAYMWNTTDPGRVPFHSLSLQLMYSLREALATVSAELIENTYARHAKTSEQLSKGLVALGLEHYIGNPEHRLTSITGFKIPKGKDPNKIASYMFRNYNIEISTGFGPTQGKILRITTYASNAEPQKIKNIIVGMKGALNSSETDADLVAI